MFFFFFYHFIKPGSKKCLFELILEANFLCLDFGRKNIGCRSVRSTFFARTLLSRGSEVQEVEGLVRSPPQIGQMQRVDEKKKKLVENMQAGKTRGSTACLRRFAVD